MDPENQKKVVQLVEQYGSENIIAVLGTGDGEVASIMAETVTAGDPTLSGALGQVSLGLKVFHVFEEEIKSLIDAAFYKEHIAEIENKLDSSNIIEEVKLIRKKYSK